MEAQAVLCAEATEIADVEDDLSRELAFYNQARNSVPWQSYDSLHATDMLRL